MVNKFDFGSNNYNFPTASTEQHYSTQTHTSDTVKFLGCEQSFVVSHIFKDYGPDSGFRAGLESGAGRTDHLRATTTTTGAVG